MPVSNAKKTKKGKKKKQQRGGELDICQVVLGARAERERDRFVPRLKNGRLNFNLPRRTRVESSRDSGTFADTDRRVHGVYRDAGYRLDVDIYAGRV